jgi:hypothetical protein
MNRRIVDHKYIWTTISLSREPRVFGLFTSNHQAQAINTYIRKRTYKQYIVNYNNWEPNLVRFKWIFVLINRNCFKLKFLKYQNNKQENCVASLTQYFYSRIIPNCSSWCACAVEYEINMAAPKGILRLFLMTYILQMTDFPSYLNITKAKFAL